MAIPIIYNLRSVRARWTSSIVAIMGIGGTVGVLLAMLAMAAGFQATLVASGSPSNALIMRAGSNSEMIGTVTLTQVQIIQSAPGVARDANGPMVSPEVVVIAPLPLKATGTDANAQIRGVSGKALEVRPSVHIIQGRMFTLGLDEIIVGKNAEASYSGLDLGSTVRISGVNWNVVGIFDSGGSAFDSELWCDAALLDAAYVRPTNIFQSVTAHLPSAGDFHAFKDALTSDPRMTVSVDRETDYYEKQSEGLANFIRVMGFMVASVMAIGAVFGALNTMYSAVSERSREVATMRAIGFSGISVVFSFVFEALFIAFIGGLLGYIFVLPLNGFTAGTLNWQTFSHVSFAFRVTPLLFVIGVCFSLLMGLIGGVPPAIRAARRPIAVALREL